MPPVKLDSQAFYPFIFLLDEKIHRGMRYCDELYGLIQEFHSERWVDALNLVHTLQESGKIATTTLERDRYCVWLSMETGYLAFIRGKDNAVNRISFNHHS